MFFILLALNVMMLALSQWGGGTHGGEPMKGHEPYRPEAVKLISEAELKAMKVSEPQIAALPPVVSAVSVAPPIPSSEKPNDIEKDAGKPPKPAPPHLLNDAEKDAGKPPKPEKPVPQQAVTALVRCVEWGGIAVGDMERAKLILQQLKLWEKASVHKIEKATGYWVFIPPRKSLVDAQKKVEELKRMGITETFIRQDGTALKYAISLGVFSTEEAAIKYLAQLREKGVRSAESGPRKRETDISVFTFKNDDALASDSVKLKKEFPGSEIKMMDCR